MQTTKPNGDVGLGLRHQGNHYSLTFESNGSWINLSDLLASLNGILEQLGIEERFIELYLGGAGMGIVAFVLPDKFLSAARKLHLRLEEAPGAQ